MRGSLRSGLDSGRRPAAFFLSTVLAAILLVIAASKSHARTIEIFPGTDVFGPAAQALAAGDTLIVHQGTYLETYRMSIRVQGTAAAPIVIKGADGEGRPLITRPASASAQNIINIEQSATYLTIKGLEIIGRGGDGVRFNGNLSHITLEDLVIHDVDVGIGAQANINNLTIRRNHIYNTAVGNGTGEGMYIGCNYAGCAVTDSVIEGNWIHDSLPGVSQGDGIEIKYGSIRNIIRDNVIYNMGTTTGYPGIFSYGYPGSTDRNIIEGNVIWNVGEGITAISDTTVRNNIIFNCPSGFGSYSHAQVSALENVTAVNNTLYNNDDGLYLRWGGTNMVLENNAVYSPGKRALATAGSGVNPSTGSIRANYVEGAMDGTSIDNVKFISGGSAGNAFVNAGANDFWPRSNSPLLGAASSSFVPSVDFNNTARVSPYDVGAYEANGQPSNPGWRIAPGFKQIGGDRISPSPPANLQRR